MFVPLYNAYGTLTRALRNDGLIISVDSALRAQLDMMAPNHSYLCLTGAAGTEIIIVYATDVRGVHVIRAVDNTDALPFNEGDSLEYVATAAGVIDSTIAPVLILERQGGIAGQGGTIGYPELQIAVAGASEIVGGHTDLVIGRSEEAYGCCDGNNAPAIIPVNPYYLTSLPYPTEVIESIQSEVKILESRLLTGDRDDIFGASTILSGGLYDVLASYSNWPLDAVDEAVTGGSTIISGTITNVLTAYSNWPLAVVDEAVTGAADIISGSYTVVLISYTYWPTPANENVTGAASIQSGTLT